VIRTAACCPSLADALFLKFPVFSIDPSLFKAQQRVAIALAYIFESGGSSALTNLQVQDQSFWKNDQLADALFMLYF